MAESESVYLDHAATTFPRKRVTERLTEVSRTVPANPESVHSPGREARRVLDDARDTFANFFGTGSLGVVFTASGSESAGLALLGTARAHGCQGHVVTTEIEHHCVLHHCEILEELGVDVTRVPVGESGVVDVDSVLGAVRDETFLVSVMAVNNEVGTVQPVEEIGAALAKDADIYFHTDAVQALTEPSFDYAELPADLISIAPHKFYGPKGTGVLVRRDQEFPIDGIVRGGSHEFDLRAGTHNTPAIAGSATALELLRKDLPDYHNWVKQMRDEFEQRLLDSRTAVEINGDPERRAAHITSLSFPGTDAESLLMRLDLEGIAASSGSACTSASLEPSHVLEAMGLAENRVNSAVRFSFGRANDPEQIGDAAGTVARVAAELAAESSAANCA